MEQLNGMPAMTSTRIDQWETKSDEPTAPEERISSLDPAHPVAKFVEQNCRVEDGEITGAKELYIGYLRWCDDTGAPPMMQRSFGMALTQMGFNRRRRGRSRNWAWWGLSLSDGSGTEDSKEELDP